MPALCPHPEGGLLRCRGQPPPWQGATRPSPSSYWPGRGPGAERAPGGCGPLWAALSPGCLPRTEVGRVGRLPSRWRELLQLSRLLLSPSGVSAGWGHIEVVLGAVLARGSGAEQFPTRN